MFLPSKHLLSAFYKKLPSKNPSKNLVFTEKIKIALRSEKTEKWQNESSPIFSNFCPDFFFEEFSCFVSQEKETRKNSTKKTALLQRKIPRQIRKKIFTDFSGEQAK